MCGWCQILNCTGPKVDWNENIVARGDLNKCSILEDN